MCLFSHRQLKANIYMSYCFLYPLFNFRYKGNLSYRSYSHYKKFYESPVLHFSCFLAKIFWPRSLGSVSAISHEGTLKLLKQSSEAFSGSKELATLALCHPTCGPWHTRTYLSKWGHNEGTSAQLFTPRASWVKKVESYCTSKARKTGVILHIHKNTSYMKSTHQKCLFLQ